MKTNKILIGGLVGAVVFFFLGWLIYGVVLSDYMLNNYDQSLSRPEEDMIWWAMILSSLASGFLIAVILNWSNSITCMDGAKKGAILGFLLSVSLDFSFYSMSTMFLSFTPVIVDVITYVVYWAIAGAVVAYAMGLVKSKA